MAEINKNYTKAESEKLPENYIDPKDVKTKSALTGGGTGGTSYITDKDGKDHVVVFNRDTKQYEDKGLADWQVSKDKNEIPSWAQQKMKESPNWDPEKLAKDYGVELPAKKEEAKKAEEPKKVSKAELKFDDWRGRIANGTASDEDIQKAYKAWKAGTYNPGPKTLELFKGMEKPAETDKSEDDKENEDFYERSMPDGEEDTANDTYAKADYTDDENKDTGITEKTFENPEEAGKKAEDIFKFLHSSKTDLPNGKLSVLGTVLSALVTAATGGAIPFINFNKITGVDEQWLAIQDLENYYNKTRVDTVGAEKNAEEAEAMANENFAKKKQNAENKRELEAQRLTGKEKGTADIENTTGVDTYKKMKDIDVEQAEKMNRIQIAYQQEATRLAIQLEKAKTSNNVALIDATEKAQSRLQSDTVNQLEKQFNAMDKDTMKKYATGIGATQGSTPNQIAAKTFTSWVKPVKEVAEPKQAEFDFGPLKAGVTNY